MRGCERVCVDENPNLFNVSEFTSECLGVDPSVVLSTHSTLYAMACMDRCGDDVLCDNIWIKLVGCMMMCKHVL